MDYTGVGIDGLCLKTEQYSIQKGVKVHGGKGKNSTMKEISNLEIKNECFDEMNYESLSQEKKDKALPLLALMIVKRNGITKTRGVTNGKHQKLYSDSDCSSPTPDFYALKHVCVSSKEDRDAATMDFPGFFLQAEADEDDEPMIIKLTGAVALFLVECDEQWRKYLRRENGK